MKKNKKYIFILIVVISFFELGLFNQVLHYGIVTSSKLFKTQEMTTGFSKMQIPNKWYLQEEDKDNYHLIGPSLSILDENQYMSVTKGEEALKKFSFYLNEQFCLDSDYITVKNNVNYIDGDHTHKLEFEAKVIFCQQAIEQNTSYVAYYNTALMLLIVIMPYQNEHKASYAKLLKSLEYDVHKEDIPIWLQEKLNL